LESFTIDAKDEDGDERCAATKKEEEEAPESSLVRDHHASDSMLMPMRVVFGG